MAGTLWTRMMWAPWRMLAVTAAAVPQSRSVGRVVAQCRSQERLAGGSREDRAIEPARADRSPPGRCRCAPRAWRSRGPDRGRSTPGGLRRRLPAASPPPAPRRPPPSHRRKPPRGTSPAISPRLCMRISAAPVSAATAAMRGVVLKAADVVDDRRATLRWPRARRRPCRCRSEIGTANPRRPADR